MPEFLELLPPKDATERWLAHFPLASPETENAVVVESANSVHGYAQKEFTHLAVEAMPGYDITHMGEVVPIPA